MASLAARRGALLRLSGEDLLIDQVGERHLRLPRRRERGGQRAAQNVVVVAIGLTLQASELGLRRRFRPTPIPHPPRFPEGVAPAKRNVEPTYLHSVRLRVDSPVKTLQTVD